LARDYLVIKYTNTQLGFIKYSNIFDFCYDLIRDYVIIKYTGKNLEVIYIFDMRIRVLRYSYDYVTKIIAKILI